MSDSIVRTKEKRDGQEPAFPFAYEVQGSVGQMQVFSNPGLTKREHFAAMAMQGILSAETNAGANWDDVAQAAVKLAETLLQELSK